MPSDDDLPRRGLTRPPAQQLQNDDHDEQREPYRVEESPRIDEQQSGRDEQQPLDGIGLLQQPPFRPARQRDERERREQR